jgi:hypothetical protein
MDLSRRKISPKELRLRGWSPEPKSRYRCYRHEAGWRIEHCGHPTALWPYLLIDPDGRIYLTGAAVSGNRAYGTAWPTIAAAVDYVASQEAR